MVMVTVPKFAITWVSNVKKSFTELWVSKTTTNTYIRTIKNKTNKQKENKYDKQENIYLRLRQ